MKIKLDNLGNFEKFDNPLRIVKPTGLIVTSKLILKGYDMFTEKPSDKETINKMESFITREIKQGKIDSRMGLGFAILSKDILNVARWDDKYPIVVVNSLYEFSGEDRNVLNAKRLKIDEVGSYCIWEMGIVNHERKCWNDYLSSGQSSKDKMNYLENFIQGEIK